MNANVSVSRRSFLAGLAGIAAVAPLAACSSDNGGAAAGSAAAETQTLVVAASPSPHAVILNDYAAPILAEQGIELEVKEYTDYILPNQDTTSGDVDANYFQHINYLNNYNEENGTDLVNVGKIHFEPMGVFPGKSTDIENVADGATIAVPNDPTNEGRALLLLQDLGLITLSEDAGITAAKNDIVDNPHNGLTFCAGSLSAGAHNNVPELARKYASRTKFVHLRSTDVFPNGNFKEASHLAGRAGIIDLVRIFQKENPALPMRVDHAPLMLGDEKMGYNAGYSFHGRMLALGQMEGVMAVVDKEIAEGKI